MSIGLPSRVRTGEPWEGADWLVAQRSFSWYRTPTINWLVLAQPSPTPAQAAAVRTTSRIEIACTEQGELVTVLVGLDEWGWLATHWVHRTESARIPGYDEPYPEQLVADERDRFALVLVDSSSPERMVKGALSLSVSPQVTAFLRREITRRQRRRSISDSAFGRALARWEEQHPDAGAVAASAPVCCVAGD